MHRLHRQRRLTPTNVVRSVASFAGLGAGVAAGLGMGLLNRDRGTALTVAAAIGSELALAGAGVSLEVEGQENLWRQRPAVFVFNHQSQLDVVVLAALLRRDFTAVAKKELSKDPTFAAMGWLADVAYVDRTDNVAAREALAPALASLESGTSLVIAPEGTRSPTPRLLPFKKGAFHLAMQAGVPMIPVVIRNAGEIMAGPLDDPRAGHGAGPRPRAGLDGRLDRGQPRRAGRRWWSRCTPTRSTTGTCRKADRFSTPFRRGEFMSSVSETVSSRLIRSDLRFSMAILNAVVSNVDHDSAPWLALSHQQHLSRRL